MSFSFLVRREPTRGTEAVVSARWICPTKLPGRTLREPWINLPETLLWARELFQGNLGEASTEPFGSLRWIWPREPKTGRKWWSNFATKTQCSYLFGPFYKMNSAGTRICKTFFIRWAKSYQSEGNFPDDALQAKKICIVKPLQLQRFESVASLVAASVLRCGTSSKYRRRFERTFDTRFRKLDRSIVGALQGTDGTSEW